MVATILSSSALTIDHRIFPVQGAISCLVGLGWVALKAYEMWTFDTASVSGPVDISRFTPVVLVTAAWALLYYAFLWDQSATGFAVLMDERDRAKAEGKPLPTLAAVKYGHHGKSARMLAADRTVGNYLEQSLAFLVSLWLHAAFVSPANAAAFGWAWVGFRFIYPWVFRLKFPGVFLSTVPAYLCILYLLGEVVRCALKT